MSAPGNFPPFQQWPPGFASNAQQATTTTTTTITTTSEQFYQGGMQQPAMMTTQQLQGHSIQRPVTSFEASSQQISQMLQQPAPQIGAPPMQMQGTNEMMHQFSSMTMQGTGTQPQQPVPMIAGPPVISDKKRDNGKSKKAEKTSKREKPPKPEKAPKPENGPKPEKASKSAKTPKPDKAPQVEKSSGFMGMFKADINGKKQTGESSKSKRTVHTQTETIQESTQSQVPHPKYQQSQQQVVQQHNHSQTVHQQAQPQIAHSSILEQYQSHQQSAQQPQVHQHSILEQYQSHQQSAQQSQISQQTVTQQTSQQVQFNQNVQQWARHDRQELAESVASFSRLASAMTNGSIARIYGVEKSSMQTWLTTFYTELEQFTNLPNRNVENWSSFSRRWRADVVWEQYDWEGLSYPEIDEAACMSSYARGAAWAANGSRGVHLHDEMVEHILANDCAACPARLLWEAHEVGYNCDGGQHFVPHTEIDMVLAGKRPHGPYIWDRYHKVWGFAHELARPDASRAFYNTPHGLSSWI